MEKLGLRKRNFATCRNDRDVGSAVVGDRYILDTY